MRNNAPTVTVPPSGLVTVMVRLPVGAFAATATDNVMVVACTLVTVALTPVPENVTVAPGANPEPVTVTVWLAAPRAVRWGSPR